MHWAKFARYAPFIGLPATQTALREFYENNYPAHFTGVARGLLPSNINTFYDMYLEERAGWSHAPQDVITTDFVNFTFVAEEHALAGEPFTLVDETDGLFLYEDTSLADQTPFPELQAQTGDLSVSENVGYPSDLVVPYNPAFPEDSPTRRRFSVPLVDCGNFGAPDANGIIEADILSFVDVYLMQPPSPQCGLGGGDQCNNANITNATVFTELVGKSDFQETEFPELVR